MTPVEEILPSLCSSCLIRKNSGKTLWNSFFFHAAYEGLLRDLILRCKAGQELHLARALGDLIAAHPGLTGPYDAVVPIPLHPARLRKRGFNQALEMARPVARLLGTAIRPGLLVRIHRTHTQTGLSIEARRQNVRNAFTTEGQVKNMRLLLVDDIATTCATLEEAARVLRKHGAIHIDVAVLARTPEHMPVVHL